MFSFFFSCFFLSTLTNRRWVFTQLLHYCCYLHSSYYAKYLKYLGTGSSLTTHLCIHLWAFFFLVMKSYYCSRSAVYFSFCFPYHKYSWLRIILLNALQWTLHEPPPWRKHAAKSSGRGKEGVQPKHKQCLRLRVIPEHVAVSSVRLVHLQLAAIIPVFTFRTSWKVSMGFPQGGGDAATMTKH